MQAPRSEPQHTRRLSTADQAAIQLQLNQWRELNHAAAADGPDGHTTHSHPTTPNPESSWSGNDDNWRHEPDSTNPLTPFLIDPSQFAQQGTTTPWTMLLVVAPP
jgi:hypothetical protein